MAESEPTDQEEKMTEDGYEVERYIVSGIEDAKRPVPAYLIVVYVALTIWGAYYLIAFWRL